ncbi:MAG: signal peptidase I [Desulfitobacteriaceae bacterium]
MQRYRSGLKWFLLVLVVFTVTLGFLRWAVVQPYLIPSSSMEPTLLPGDRIIVNRLTYRDRIPARGDIVVFAYPKDPKRTFVKRVIALEGDTAELRDNKVFINGKALEEPYLKAGDYPPYGPEVVPKGKFLVLGDNRRQSGDSREWGLLSQEALIGKAWMIYYPLNRWKLF